MLLRFLHKVPTFRLLVSWIIGALIVSFNLRVAWSLIVFGFWGLLFFRYIEDKMTTSWHVRWIPGICMACIWIALGAFSTSARQQDASFPANNQQKIAALVSIESVLQEKPKTRQCRVRILHTENEGWKGKLLQLYIAKDKRSASLNLGDHLLIDIKPQQPESPTDSRAFDYAGWLRHQGVCATAYVPAFSWTFHSKASPRNLSVSAERFRSILLERFRQAGITGEEYSLVSALTLGSVNLLTPETKKQFSVSGVSHILSVSGLHVAVIYAVLEFLFSFFNRFEKLRVLKQIIIMSILWCYAFMTGFSPSVIRSAFMFSIFAFGRCLDRKSQTINTVLFSAFVLLIWNPFFLYDLGFELSYCAVISIVVLHERLTRMWQPSSKMVRYLWEMICLSTVAQLGTAPITIFHFHQFPNYFLLNNLVAVPASSLIIYLASAFLFLSDIPYLGDILTWSLNGSLHWFQWFVKTTSELPFALTENIEIQEMEVFALYALMGSFFVWFFLKKRKWIFMVLICVLCLQGLILSQYFRGQKGSGLCEISVNSYICEKRNPCLQKLLPKT